MSKLYIIKDILKDNYYYRSLVDYNKRHKIVSFSIVKQKRLSYDKKLITYKLKSLSLNELKTLLKAYKEKPRNFLYQSYLDKAFKTLENFIKELKNG